MRGRKNAHKIIIFGVFFVGETGKRGKREQKTTRTKDDRSQLSAVLLRGARRHYFSNIQLLLSAIFGRRGVGGKLKKKSPTLEMLLRSEDRGGEVEQLVTPPSRTYLKISGFAKCCHILGDNNAWVAKKITRVIISKVTGLNKKWADFLPWQIRMPFGPQRRRISPIERGGWSEFASSREYLSPFAPLANIVCQVFLSPPRPFQKPTQKSY